MKLLNKLGLYTTGGVIRIFAQTMGLKVEMFEKELERQKKAKKSKNQ